MANATKYFENMNTVEDVKSAYIGYSKKYKHEGNTFKAIMKQYGEAYDELRDKHADKSGKIYTHATEQTSEEFANMIDAIINIPDVDISIKGTWVYVRGDKTKEYKDIIKGAGFWFLGGSKCWYYKDGLPKVDREAVEESKRIKAEEKAKKSAEKTTKKSSKDAEIEALREQLEQMRSLLESMTQVKTGAGKESKTQTKPENKSNNNNKAKSDNKNTEADKKSKYSDAFIQSVKDARAKLSQQANQ